MGFQEAFKSDNINGWRITTGRSFHSFGAAAVNERSPRVATVLILGY